MILDTDSHHNYEIVKVQTVMLQYPSNDKFDECSSLCYNTWNVAEIIQDVSFSAYRIKYITQINKCCPTLIFLLFDLSWRFTAAIDDDVYSSVDWFECLIGW